MAKKTIRPDETIPIQLSEADRDLILEHTFLEDELIVPLEAAISQSGHITFEITLADLDFLLGYIAGAANHTEDRKLEDSLDEIYDRLSEVEAGYVVVEE